MSETQLAKLVAFVPSIEIGKILGQLKPTLQSVNVVTSIWAKPSCGSYFANYAKKLMCPCKDRWTKRGGELGLFQISKANKTTLTYVMLVRLNSPTG